MLMACLMSLFNDVRGGGVPDCAEGGEEPATEEVSGQELCFEHIITGGGQHF